MRVPAIAALLLLGCSSELADSAPRGLDLDAAAVEGRLRQTLDELATLGERRAGTTAGAEAGDYLARRFEEAGLSTVHFEPFSLLGWSHSASSLDVRVDGVALPMAHDVFAYSGTASVSGELVDVGTGHEQDYAGKDVSGKIVVVTRDSAFHRSSQYRLVIAHGGGAMLYVSQSPDNLIQIGTVADPEDGLGAIAAITVGADDGAAIVAAIADGKAVTATVDVQASLQPATGRNVVGLLPGRTDDYLLVGAHYDSWYVGAADNGTGVAALVELATQLAQAPAREHGLVFVGYDGEELGLFGGYDYLRKHVVVAGEPLLGFVNLEMPAASPGGLKIIAHTNDGPVDPALTAADMHGLYNLYVGMELVPSFFGGVIPTDIQGFYWGGIQGATTACDSPYYHTTEDTPDRVDVAFLVEAVAGFRQALASLDQVAADSFSARDRSVWDIEATTAHAGSDLVVDLVVRDASGAAQPSSNVRLWLDVDDFTRAFDAQLQTDAQGAAQVVVPASALGAGAGGRWLHVTAGADYPLAERILPLD